MDGNYKKIKETKGVVVDEQTQKRIDQLKRQGFSAMEIQEILNERQASPEIELPTEQRSEDEEDQQNTPQNIETVFDKPIQRSEFKNNLILIMGSLFGALVVIITLAILL